MATEKIKGDCGEMVDKESHAMLEDRISQLPDPLIHHIFSSLPTIYLFRMSLLSKRWRHLWVSTPFLYFDDFRGITFKKNVRKRDMVLKFMTNYLRHRKECMQIPDMFLLSFRCCIDYNFASSSSAREIDDCLNSVVKSNVKELDLDVEKYCLPQFVLNASSLTVLKLSSLKLVAPSLSTFPSLKVLFLICVDYDVKSLQNIISGCPIIEELHLSYGIVPTEFTVSRTLKNLSLSVEFLNDQWLDGLICGLPLLERLALDSQSMKIISIRSQSLKYVFIDLSFNIFEEVALTITTPNLVFLHLKCYAWNIICSVEAPNLLEGKLSIQECSRSMRKAPHMELLRLLSNLNFLKKIILDIWVEEVLIFLESIRKKCPPPLPNLEHLKVYVCFRRSYRTAKLRDSLLWCAPSLKSLQIV